MKSMLYILLVLGAWSGVAEAKGIYDEKHGSSYNNAAPDEMMMLPKYCWGHYNRKFTAPKYNINRQSCGPMMNHFCPGILRYNRSQNPMASRDERNHYLRHSMKNFDYSMKGMKEYPGCYIRKHVMMMHKRARMSSMTALP